MPDHETPSHLVSEMLVLQDQQIDALFYKIDWSSDGNITWDEFCTYMQLEYAEKEDSYQRSVHVMAEGSHAT